MDDDHARLFTAKYQPQPQPCLPVFRNRISLGRWSSAWHTYLNHCLFATVVIDRFAMLPAKVDIEQEGSEYLRELARQDDGFLMFSSHIGCYEVAGYSLTPPGKRYNALVYGGEKTGLWREDRNNFLSTISR